MKSSEEDIDEEEVEEEELFCHPYMNLMDESKITHVSTFLNSQPLSPSYMWHPSAENSEEEIEDIDEFFARATAELEENIEASIAAIKKEMKNSECQVKDPNDDSGLSDSSRISCSTTELNESEPEKSITEGTSAAAGKLTIPKLPENQGDGLKGHDNTDSSFPVKHHAYKILDDEALMEADEKPLYNGPTIGFSDSDEETSKECSSKNERSSIRQTSGKEECRKGVSSLIYEFQQQINSSKEVNNLPSKVSTKNSPRICCNSNEFTKCCSHNIINSNLHNHHSSSQKILTSPDIVKANAKIPNKNVWGKIQNFEATFQKEIYDNRGAETENLKLPNVNLLTNECCYRKGNLNDFKNKLNDILSMNGKANGKDSISAEVFRDEDDDVCSFNSNESALIDVSEEETSAETKISEVFDRLNMIPRSYYLNDVLEDDKLPNLSMETPEKLSTLLNSRLLSFSFYLRHRDNDLLTCDQNLELDNMIKSSCFAFQNSEEGVGMVKDLILSSLCGSPGKNVDEEILIDEKCEDFRRNNDLEHNWLQSIPRACFNDESNTSNSCPTFSLDIFNLKLMSEIFKTCWTRKPNVDEINDSQNPSGNEVCETDCNFEKSDNLVKEASMEQKCLLDFFSQQEKKCDYKFE